MTGEREPAAGPGGESPRPASPELIGAVQRRPADLVDGGHTVAELIDDSIRGLCALGHIELDDDEGLPPAGTLAEVTQLAATCRECDSPDRLVNHLLSIKQAEWERSLPVWRCDCGARYKVLAEGRGDDFYKAARDGTLGAQAGHVRHDSKGRVKHSDACPGCKEPFAATIARQTRSPVKLAPPEKTADGKPAQDVLF